MQGTAPHTAAAYAGQAASGEATREVAQRSAAAAARRGEAAARRDTYQDALAEDMEAFSVALACALHRVPVSVVRGISNVAGDRQRSNWKVEQALREAARLLEDVLERNTPDSETRPR